MVDWRIYIGTGFGVCVWFAGKKALEHLVSQGGFVRPKEEITKPSDILECFGYYSQENFYCQKPEFSKNSFGKLAEKLGYFKE